MRPLPRASTALASAAAGRRAVIAASAASATLGLFAARRAVVIVAASPSPAPPPPPPPPLPPAALSGTWHLAQKDPQQLDNVMRLWGLPAIARRTATLIKGFEMTLSPPPSDNGGKDENDDGGSSKVEGNAPLSSSPSSVQVRYLCPVPQFDVRETVPVGGAETRLRRRDLRPGGATAAAHVLECGGGVCVRTEWEGCQMEERYEASDEDPDTLTLRTMLVCRRRGGPETARAVQVYKRSSSS